MNYPYSFLITKQNVWRLFILYCCALFYTVFLTPNRYAGRVRMINIVPVVDTIKRFYGQGNEHFWAYYIGYWGNIFGNVILFMPFGFLLSCLYPQVRWKTILLFGLFVSTGIELTQYVLQIGVCDIDDIIFNVCGTAAGIFVYRKIISIKQK